MKIAYIVPASISFVKGGLKTQAVNTTRILRAKGIEVQQINPWEETNINDFDALHIFGASPENIGIIKAASGYNIPLIMSSVFFSNRSAKSIKYRLYIDKLLGLAGSGMRSEYSIKEELFNYADYILPNTDEEAALIHEAFGVSRKKLYTVPNGVEENFTSGDPSLFRKKYDIENYLLFVGHAGSRRKNVLNLIRAVYQLSVPLVIIGDFYDDDYGIMCKNMIEGNENIHLLGSLEHNSDMLKSAYAGAEIFVLPSLFETPGIAAMEAALNNCKIVITENGGTKEYFNEHAFYINPFSEISIQSGIERAMDSDINTEDLKNHILNHYTYDIIAEKLIDLYKNVIE